jgi:hypothetical protein
VRRNVPGARGAKQNMTRFVRQSMGGDRRSIGQAITIVKQRPSGFSGFEENHPRARHAPAVTIHLSQFSSSRFGHAGAMAFRAVSDRMESLAMPPLSGPSGHLPHDGGGKQMPALFLSSPNVAEGGVWFNLNGIRFSKMRLTGAPIGHQATVPRLELPKRRKRATRWT